MGASHYTAAVDVWSVGCIFGELLGRRILFQAQSPVQQVGTPLWMYWVLSTGEPRIHCSAIGAAL